MEVFSIVWCVFIMFVWYACRMAFGVIGGFGGVDIERVKYWRRMTLVMSGWCALLAAPALLYLGYLCFAEYRGWRARKIEFSQEFGEDQKSAEERRKPTQEEDSL